MRFFSTLFCPSLTESTTEESEATQYLNNSNQWPDSHQSYLHGADLVEYDIGQIKFSNKKQKTQKGQGFTQTPTESPNKSLPTVK